MPSQAISSLTDGLKVRVETQLDETILTVAVDDYRTVCERLYAHGFDFPASLTGVDMEWGLGVVLHVQQLESKRKVAVRTYVPYDAPKVPSVSDLWGGVEWHEREAYDLVGITFTNHPDLRRILLEDHWTIHPLQRKYNTRGYAIAQWSARPWPVPAPWEEGFTPFAAAAPAPAHAKPATPTSTAAAASTATPSSVAAETKAAIEQGAPVAPAPSGDAAALGAAPAEPPKKVAKKWVPKTPAGDAPPSSDAATAAPTSDGSTAGAPVTSSPAPAVSEGVSDDLKRIEGIGPKMAAALNAAGITTFTQLAASSELSLRSALEAAGQPFAPSMNTWVEQAGFLARGDEAGFSALTARLTSGRNEAGSSESAPSTAPEGSAPESSAPGGSAPEDKPRSPKIKRWEPKS